MTYGTLSDSEDNFWSLLYLTGYLTKADKNPTEGNNLNLRIPNAEIRDLFKATIMDRFKKTIRTVDHSKLFNAFWNGDVAAANKEVDDLLFSTISYYDSKEDFYHAFIAGMFAGVGYAVLSNRELGDGRPDIIVMDTPNRQALVIEIKRSASEEGMEGDCDQALQQIVDRKYAKAVEFGYTTILSYGIAFYKKSCLIKKVVSASELSKA